jgi:DNA-binding ferritin-like protein
MNLTPINIYTSSNIDKNLLNDFSLYLCDVLSSFRILHWHSKDYNFHKIVGKFYSDFDEIFDSLIEEIIGVSNIKNINFNVKSPERDLTNLNKCFNKEEQIKEVFSVLDSLENTLKGEEMQYFVSSSFKNGINNTIDEILSLSNSFKYLLSMLDVDSSNNSYTT